MFKIVILVMALLIFPSCEDYITEKLDEYYNEIYDLFYIDRYERIEDWQNREIECLGYPNYHGDESFIVDLNLVNKIKNEVMNRIKYKADRSNYWQTSCETEIKGEGDCEDFAIVIWKELRDAGFPDNIVGIGIAENDRGQCHAFTLVYYTPGDFYIVDASNSFWFKVIDSKLLDESVKLLMGCNLFSIWEF